MRREKEFEVCLAYRYSVSCGTGYEGTLRLLPYNLQFFADDGGEKTEEPTAKKLTDARNKGQVANSKEVSNTFTLLILFILIRLFYGYMAERFREIFRLVYNEIPANIIMYEGEVPFRTIESVLNNALLNIILIALPFLLGGVTVALIANIIQIGFKVTWEPLKPKFNKLNPLSGIKRIFSLRSLFELAKSIAKIALIGFVVYNYLAGRTESLFLLYDMPLGQCIMLMGNIIVDMGIRVAAIYAIIAAADVAYTRWKFHNDMKMTKQEVKDEYKNSEGDPQIKGKIRQKMQEASRRRMMQQLPQADVVITNPTHYAVAIKYDPEQADAPQVIAKGADYLALQIREKAKEFGVEIVENKPLARMLYTNCEIGEFVPPELYQAVAEVLAYVYHLQGKV
ncbi:MAG: flagellar biosynthesis protein FlhB [Butyrivibrio sp.]|nr:flagellar biosynthesis protein FlhB [Butyrivibrio sp.]